MSEEQEIIIGPMGVVSKETIIGQYMAMLRNFEGYAQEDFARSMGYSRPCLSKFETGEKNHEVGFYRILRKDYLKRLKLKEAYVLKLLKESSGLFRAFMRTFKRYSSIFFIASHKVRCRDKQLVKECRKCMLDVIDYLLVRGFFKVYGLKPGHIGMVFSDNVRDYKYRKAPVKRQQFEASFARACKKAPELINFSAEKIWNYFNNKRSLCCKKLEETSRLIFRIGLV